jgi:hypothetical protein
MRAGECSIVSVWVDGECEGDCWHINPILVLGGDINLFTGDFRNLPIGARPDDPNITNSTQALDHAYRLHINPARRKAVNSLDKLGAMTFQTKQVCQSFCSEVFGRRYACIHR